MKRFLNQLQNGAWRQRFLPFLVWMIALLPNWTHATTYNVSTLTQFNSAVSSAAAGDIIIIANGTYNNWGMLITSKTGTASAPITIKAASVCGVTFTGDSYIRMSGAYIVIEGLKFTSGYATNGKALEFRTSSSSVCNNCRVTQVTFDAYNQPSSLATGTYKWISVYGQNNEIDHCSFLNKVGKGSSLVIERPDNTTDNCKIHHNYFAGRRWPSGYDQNLNDQDAIRIGNSATHESTSNTEIYDNYFYDWIGEGEIISVKSCDNKIYNNTFRGCLGALTFRHGHRNQAYQNFFIGNAVDRSAGVRIIGEDHKVYNNYFEGLRRGSGKNTGAVNIARGQSSPPDNGYEPVINAQVAHNTFVDCDRGIWISASTESTLSVVPSNIKIGNNIMLNTTDAIFIESGYTPTSPTYEGNTRQSGSWGISTSGTNVVVSSGLLDSPSGGYYRIGSTSPAKDAATGTYTFVVKDIKGGGDRSGTKDRGAEEYGLTGSNRPFTSSDVEVNVGACSAVVSCDAPTGLSASSITSSGATLSWSAVSGALNYNLQYRVNGTSTWTTVSSISGTSYNLSGLSGSTTYQWQVRTNCSSTNSNYTAGANFTTSTVITCNAPTGLSASSITSSGATLSWSAVSGALNYNLQYRVNGTSTWTTVSSISGTSYNLSGLSGSTTYQWQVRTNCSSTNSSYTAGANFTTSSGGGTGGEIWLEGECGVVGSDWETINDANASNGQFIRPKSGKKSTSSAPTATSARVSFSFNATGGSGWTVHARVKISGSSDDSFWVRINGGSWIQWSPISSTGGSFAWRELINGPFSLNNGANTIDFAYRENLAGLDKLYITNTTNTPSGTGSTASNCSGGTSCTSGTNLALNKTIADFSSQQTGNEVTNVNDGNTTNRWSAEIYPQYVTIDLGAAYSVNQIKLHPYQDRAYQFKVEGSTTSATSGFSTLTDLTGNTTGGSIITSSFTAQTVRYVKLTVTGASGYTGTWISIEEFEVICAGGSGSLVATPNQILQPVSLEKNRSQVYPNPFQTGFNLQIPKDLAANASVNLLDALGRVVYQQRQVQPGELIAINQPLQAGFYWIQIRNEQGVIIENIKILKQ